MNLAYALKSASLAQQGDATVLFQIDWIPTSERWSGFGWTKRVSINDNRWMSRSHWIFVSVAIWRSSQRYCSSRKHRFDRIETDWKGTFCPKVIWDKSTHAYGS